MTDLLDRREVRIRRMFDGIAPRYDLLNHLLSLNVDRVWRRRVVSRVPSTTGPVLDVCTGTGDLAFEYDRACRGAVPIVGADFAGEMLIQAVEKSRRRGSHPRIGLVQADAQRLPPACMAWRKASASASACVEADSWLRLRRMSRASRA